MRINHNVTAMVTANNLSNVNTGQGKVLQRLGSGQKINKAGDNSAGLAISEKMRGELAQLKQEKANQQDLVAFTNAQDGALNEISNVLVATQQLLAQSGDAWYESGNIMMNDVAIGNIYASLEAYSDALQTFLHSEMNGLSLFTDESLAKVGATDPEEHRHGDYMSTVNPESARSMLNNYMGWVDAILVSTGERGHGLDATKAMVDAVNDLRGSIGAKSNQAEAAVRNLSTQIENLQDAESRIRDADMAEETVEYQKNNILNQAATSMLAQANQQPQSVLSLLE